MSENISVRHEARPEDLPPLHPFEAIVGNIAERTDEEIASLYQQYTPCLELEMMPDTRGRVERIVWAIEFEMRYRLENPDFANEINMLENAYAQ